MNPITGICVPVGGLVGETLKLGLAWIAKGVDTPDDLTSDELIPILTNAKESVRRKIEIGHSSKIGKNDRDSFSRSFGMWFGGLRSSTYLELFLEVIDGTISLMGEGRINPKESLYTINAEKSEITLGRECRGAFAILPAILKQPEYYEYQSEYLKPTTGGRAMIKMDPFWFSILGLGFLTSFAGYRGGSYYLLTKPGIDVIYGNPGKIEELLEDLTLLTETIMNSNASIDSEEIYELKLAMWLAKERKMIKEEHYPFLLHVLSLMGNVYTETKTMEIDLRELQNYMSSYIRKIEGLKAAGYDLTINTRNQGALYPLEALVDLAGQELKKNRNVSGDNELLAYIMVKDLYRAVVSGNRRLMEDTLFRIFRHSNGLLQSESKANSWFKAVMWKFMWDKHLEALQI